MPDWLVMLFLIAAWFILQTWVFPRAGIST